MKSLFLVKLMQTIPSKNEEFGQGEKAVRKEIILSLREQKAWMASEKYLAVLCTVTGKTEQKNRVSWIQR